DRRRAGAIWPHGQEPNLRELWAWPRMTAQRRTSGKNSVRCGQNAPRPSQAQDQSSPANLKAHSALSAGFAPDGHAREIDDRVAAIKGRAIRLVSRFLFMGWNSLAV